MVAKEKTIMITSIGQLGFDCATTIYVGEEPANSCTEESGPRAEKNWKSIAVFCFPSSKEFCLLLIVKTSRYTLRIFHNFKYQG